MMEVENEKTKSALISADMTLNLNGTIKESAFSPRLQSIPGKMPFSFRNTASPPKTPTNRAEEISLLSTSNKSSTLQKMQPRDFGLRISGNNRDLAEISGNEVLYGQSMSFAKLADSSHKRRNDKYAKTNV